MDHRSLPLIRLLLIFIAGIIVFDSLNGVPAWFVYAAYGLMLFCLIWLLTNLSRGWVTLRFVTGFLVYLSVFASGVLISKSYYERNVSGPSLAAAIPGQWVAEVVSQPASRIGSFRLNVHVVAVKQADSLITTHFGAILYLPLTTVSVPHVGDIIAVSAPLKEIPKSLNPGAFDYHLYLARKGIHRQAWLPEGSFRVLNERAAKSIFYYAEKVRWKLLEIIAQRLPDKTVSSVASAILLGYGDLLDPGLRQAYAGSGAMHVLCVSGLHVGILYAIFAALLFPLDRSRRGEALKTILLLILIWGYALLAGLSVSVARSATMFTFVAIGKGFNRRTSALNSLLASGFFLLVVDPYYLFEVGFQLSFAAVAGIVLFQPVLAQLWPADNRVVIYIRDLITVSVAAQLFTMPVTLLNFHQFPNYFFLANLVVIPLSFCILVVGMATMFFHWLPYVGYWLLLTLSFLIGLMNRGVTFIEHLPGSLSYFPVFGKLDALLLFAVVLGLLYWVVMRFQRGLWFALISLLMLITSVQISRFHYIRQKLFVIADGGKCMLLGTIRGREANWMGRSGEAPRFFLSGINQHFAVSPDHSFYKSFFSSGNDMSSHFRVVNNRRIVIVDSSFRLLRGKSRLTADLVLVEGYPRMKPEWVVPRIDSAVWVLSPCLTVATRKRWEQECCIMGASVYRMDSLGAFIIPE